MRKCSILFSPNVEQQVKEEICVILNVQKETFESKYLGLPTPTGHIKREAFQPIKERMAKRTMDWSDRDISTAGKEALIKSVAQALPTYCMRVFKLSDGLCEDLMKQIRKYWWGVKNGKHRTHWCAMGQNDSN